jgi:Carotenoid biosynthesis protein
MKKLLSLILRSFASLEKYQRYTLYTWLLVMLLLPLLSAKFDEQTLRQGLTLAILLQVAFVVQVLYRSWGWRGMLRTCLEVIFLVWAVMAIIIRSGLPYGNLFYTALQKPQLLGVPVIAPLAWLMMLAPSWAVARVITRRMSGCLMRLVFVLVSALVFTAWMIYFLPFLAYLGILEWNPPGALSGIPWQHFFGIYFLAGLVTFAVSPKHLYGGPLVFLYVLTWLVDAFALLIFHGLALPVIISSILMGIVLCWAMLVSR